MMTESHIVDKDKGLTIGSKAPIIETKDIFDNEIKLNDLLEKYDGVMIEFFRGQW